MSIVPIRTENIKTLTNENRQNNYHEAVMFINLEFSCFEVWRNCWTEEKPNKRNAFGCAIELILSNKWNLCEQMNN